MIEMNDEQLIDLWDMFTSHIPKKDKESAALGFIKWCQDNGIEEEVLYNLADEDPYLQEAVEEVQGTRETPYAPDKEYADDEDGWSEYTDDDNDEWN